MKSSAQHKPTIGAMLADRREQLGIPIERAAKESRIRAQRLREIEQDDFSELSNASYVRMFLIAYAKYLGIPREDLDDFLPEQGVPGSDNYQYIQGTSSVLPTIRYQPKPLPSPRKRLLFTVATIVVLTLLVVGAGIASYLAINLSRLPSGRSDAANVQEPVIEEVFTPPVPPVIPPGVETVETVAFQSSISITVSEMVIVAQPVTDLSLPEAEAVDLPAEAETNAASETDMTVDQSAAFAEDVEFLLGSSAEEPTNAER